MKITSNDDRELILSEVYALQNDVDMEVSMLGKQPSYYLMFFLYIKSFILNNTCLLFINPKFCPIL